MNLTQWIHAHVCFSKANLELATFHHWVDKIIVVCPNQVVKSEGGNDGQWQKS